MPDTTDETLANELKNEPALQDRPRNKLPPDMEREIEERRQRNVLAATIAGLSWGKNMTPVVRRAFADYCERFDVDPITEMDNLGGQPYVNADWYKRKLGELIVRGIVKDYKLEHIQADPRLEKIFRDESFPQEMRDEARRRWFENAMRRVEQNAPEEAEAICVCTITLPNGTTAVGCKWAGNKTSVWQPRHGGGGAPNPIAEMNPTLSVESMSIRRALSQLLSHISGQRISGLTWARLDEMSDELDDLQRVAVREAPAPTDPPAPDPGKRALSSGNYDEDAAALGERIKQSHGDRVPVEVASTPAPLSAFAHLRDMPDPYGLDDPHEVNLTTRGPEGPTMAQTPPEATDVGDENDDESDERPAALDPAPGPPATDLFGSETPVEPTSLDVIRCELCENDIRKGHPEDHAEWCDGYRPAR